MAVTEGKARTSRAVGKEIQELGRSTLSAAHSYGQKGWKESMGLTSHATVASLARQCDSGDHLTGPSAKCDGVPAD